MDRAELDVKTFDCVTTGTYQCIGEMQEQQAGLGDYVMTEDYMIAFELLIDAWRLLTAMTERLNTIENTTAWEDTWVRETEELLGRRPDPK
jgi:hypothetical protein